MLQVKHIFGFYYNLAIVFNYNTIINLDGVSCYTQCFIDEALSDNRQLLTNADTSRQLSY